MIIAGASRHAKEICQLIDITSSKIEFFDDYSKSWDSFFDDYSISKSIDELKSKKQIEFVLGLGGTINRFSVAEKLINAGYLLTSIVAKTAIIGDKDVHLGNGLNIMHFSFIGNSVIVGEGTLVNAFASIHHDVFVGKYCEISPRATILGGAKIGDFSSIGAAAVILPNIKVGKNCIIGAGSVVLENIPDNTVVVGNPARIIKLNL